MLILLDKKLSRWKILFYSLDNDIYPPWVILLGLKRLINQFFYTIINIHSLKKYSKRKI